MLVFCRYAVVYFAIPQVIKGNGIDCIIMYTGVFWDLKTYMFLRRSLARAYKLHVHDFYVGTFGGLAPQYQKAGYATAHTDTHAVSFLYIATPRW